MVDVEGETPLTGAGKGFSDDAVGGVGIEGVVFGNAGKAGCVLAGVVEGAEVEGAEVEEWWTTSDCCFGGFRWALKWSAILAEESRRVFVPKSRSVFLKSGGGIWGGCMENRIFQ